MVMNSPPLIDSYQIGSFDGFLWPELREGLEMSHSRVEGVKVSRKKHDAVVEVDVKLKIRFSSILAVRHFVITSRLWNVFRQ